MKVTYQEGQLLTIMPQGLEVKPDKSRCIIICTEAFAGQRTAINLTSVSKEDLERGDVLVSSEHFIVTKTLMLRFMLSVTSIILLSKECQLNDILEQRK